MKNEKNTWKSITVIAIVLSVLAIAMVGTASAKSLYGIAEHHTGQFDAYKINPGCPVTYQKTYNLTVSTNPAGIAIDEGLVVGDPATLFITSEFSNIVELVDARTMKFLGTAVATGASDLAGIDVDSENSIIYTVDRGTNNLYVYDWNRVARNLTLNTTVSLTNCSGAWGVSLNKTSGILYVADSLGGKVRGYNVTTWAEVQTFTPSQTPCDVAVDKQRGFIYTTAPDGSCAYAISGIDILVKINIATGTETNVSLGHGSMGVAVDCDTGCVYVTGGCLGDNLEVWNTTTTPWTQVQDTGVIGNPAGICIPQKEIEYKPPAPVPALTPIGLIALVGLLSVIAAMSIRTGIRKRR